MERKFYTFFPFNSYDPLRVLSVSKSSLMLYHALQGGEMSIIS